MDQYASPESATAAYRQAVQLSEAAPGFKPAPAPTLGDTAFAGTSQVGADQHFGLGARQGALIMSATIAGLPVTPQNTGKLITLGSLELEMARQILGSPASP